MTPLPLEKSNERWKLWRLKIDKDWRLGEPDPFYDPDAVEMCELMSVAEHETISKQNYWAGAYQEVQRLSRSPRFNRPQLALIMDEAAMIREKAEACGMKFSGPEPERPDLEKYR